MEDEWTVNANEALFISLVRPTSSGLEKIATFNPKFTYAIFGEDERIFGYKGLKINLQYDARDLRPNLSVTSSRKFASVAGVEALDVRETLKEFLPGVAFQGRQEYDSAVRNTPETWAPPGTLVKTAEKDGEIYEVWHGTMADLAVKQMLKRIQVMVLLFIEGGSYIGQNPEGKEEPEYSLARWSVFFIYKKQPTTDAPDKHRYIFQGFSTVYDFWMFQQPTPRASPAKDSIDHAWELPEGDFSLKDLPSRSRISQFVILPPFQGKGVGALLYNTIFCLGVDDASVKEVTVEDPNEDFDLVRDLCDMKYLRKNIPGFAALKVNANVSIPEKGAILHNNTRVSSPESGSSSADGIVDMDALEAMRVKAKIAPRQFWRLTEMHLMSTLPDSVRPRPDTDSVAQPSQSKADLQAYTVWRLLLKQRLYRRNANVLGEFEITERIIKLNETVSNVEWEYARILERLEPKAVVANSKRKLDSEAEEASTSSKRARVEDA
ncbi:Uu.00g001090.m01.CDS01 [Anthostomella pinea]|uniref:Histone acetyltransferase type B catalytic subunit n=1 Tax=Anthostomella pinea TaxID=933095 RepID=A0AAI8VKF7_9PEZI|nr:Uu.00g001090.m01.CDS01 [Anthostomella pinea]